LADLVLNSNDFYRIIERDGKLVQRIHPIYQDPVGSNILRSHFFAPRKQFFGLYIDTYWANVMVIWLMTAFLAITLRFDVLSRILGFFAELADRFPQLRKRN
jgi:hypothetical protein